MCIGTSDGRSEQQVTPVGMCTLQDLNAAVVQRWQPGRQRDSPVVHAQRAVQRLQPGQHGGARGRTLDGPPAHISGEVPRPSTRTPEILSHLCCAVSSSVLEQDWGRVAFRVRVLALRASWDGASCWMRNLSHSHDQSDTRRCCAHPRGALQTAQNGCSEPNDGLDDTAEEAQPQFGCPSPAPSSCPGKPANQPALDPINNFMVSFEAAVISLGLRRTSWRNAAAARADAAQGCGVRAARLPRARASHAVAGCDRLTVCSSVGPRCAIRTSPRVLSVRQMGCRITRRTRA